MQVLYKNGWKHQSYLFCHQILHSKKNLQWGSAQNKYQEAMDDDSIWVMKVKIMSVIPAIKEKVGAGLKH